MLVYRSFNDLKTYLDEQIENGLTIGLVPTMGALHEGHISLVRNSISKTDITICSIFVNPAQFNVSEDLEKYPRTEDDDLNKLRIGGCHVVFIPIVKEVYPSSYKSIEVDLNGIDLVMEGRHRPGHFAGVVQVISRFFEQIDPDYAFFGEKDYQQLAVIERLVEIRKFKTKIIGCSIIREESGLAMSSRNMRLSESGKNKATIIYELLSYCKANYSGNNSSELVAYVLKQIRNAKELTLDYFEIADAIALKPVTNVDEKARAFIAAEVEGIRLIDNMGLN